MSTACNSPVLISHSTRALYHRGMKMFICTMHIPFAIGWATIGRFRERGGGFKVLALEKIVNVQWQVIHYDSKSTRSDFSPQPSSTRLPSLRAKRTARVGKQTERRHCLPPSSLPAPPWTTWASEIFHRTLVLDLFVRRSGPGRWGSKCGCV